MHFVLQMKEEIHKRNFLQTKEQIHKRILSQ